MKLTLNHCRTTVIAAVAFVVIITALWWGLWLIAATQYRHVIDGWVTSGRAEGYEITYDENQLFGFPRHLVLRFTNVHWKDTNNILFHADDIDIGALPWQWRNYTAKFKNHVEITAPIDEFGHALILGGEDGRANVELDRQGYWQLSQISLTHARLGQTPDYVVTADKLQASAERPLHMPKDHTEAGLTLTGSAENVILPNSIPSPFGNQMHKLDINMRLMGVVPDFRKKESVDAWNKESGVVEFDNLHMDWGPLQITAKGTMGFDDDLQPEGAFVGALSDHTAVLKALMEHGYIAKSQEAMMSSALTLFAKPSKFSNNTGIELPIAVQLGGLFLGPVKIFAFPEIDWPSAAPVPTLPPVMPAVTPSATPAAP
jgi:hypothetical protein